MEGGGALIKVFGVESCRAELALTRLSTVPLRQRRVSASAQPALPNSVTFFSHFFLTNPTCPRRKYHFHPTNEKKRIQIQSMDIL